MTSRRQFLSSLFAGLVTAPLLRLGWIKPPVPSVKGAGQTGSSIITDGWAPNTTVLRVGDVITFPSVNHCNPIHFGDTGIQRTFVVTEAVVSDSNGDAVIPILPPLVVGNTPYRNATASPADNSPIQINQPVGMSLRFIRNQQGSRIDVLYGLSAIQPEFACRIVA